MKDIMDQFSQNDPERQREERAHAQVGVDLLRQMARMQQQVQTLQGQLKTCKDQLERKGQQYEAKVQQLAFPYIQGMLHPLYS